MCHRFLLFPIASLTLNQYSTVLKYTEWIEVVLHIWLLYFYVSPSLRENILRVNGSRILPWWIYHHYISAIMSIVALTWPITELHHYFRPQFNIYFLFQGFVQFLQAYYQKKRHYVAVSLGTVGGDFSRTKSIPLGSGNSSLLLPPLVLR